MSHQASAAQLAVVCFAMVFGLGIVLFRQLVLPQKFLFDGTTIQRLAINGNADGAADDSFGNVAALYRILGLEQNATLAGLLGYAFALVLIGLVLRRAGFAMTPMATVAVTLSVVFSAIYLGTYSKDVFVLPVALIVLKVREGFWRDIGIVVSLLAYAHLFRTYWFLVAGLYLAYLLLARLVRPRWALWLAPPVALVVLGFAFPLALGVASDFARAGSNAYRIGSPDAATMITDFVHLPGALNSVVNTLLVLLTVFVPVPLLFHGGAYYALIFIAFVAIWLALVLGLRRMRGTATATRIVVLLLAFVTTQALFEPDYGSMLRHLTPLLPLLCTVALTRHRPEPAPAAAPMVPTAF